MAFIQNGFDGHQPPTSRTLEMNLDRGVRGCLDRLSTYCLLPACSLSQHEKSQLEDLEARYSYWEKDVVALRSNRDLNNLDVAQYANGILTKQDLAGKLDMLKKILQDVEQMSLAWREKREINTQDCDSDERLVLELKEEVSAKSISPHHLTTQNDHVPTSSTDSEAADKFILAKHIITSLHKITSYLIAVEPTETPSVQAIGTPDLLLDTKTLSAKYSDLAENSPWLLERIARASGTARQRLIQLQKQHQAATQTDRPVGSQPIEQPEEGESSYVSLIESRPNNDPPNPLLGSLMSTSPKMPAVPKNAKYGPVFCQLCYEVVDLGYRHTESRWCQHVLQDLKPYVCTFEGCEAPSFASLNQWFEHELEMHRHAWTCDFCSTFETDDPTVFAFHVGGCIARSKSIHLEELLDLPTIMTACQGPICVVKSAECPFCGYEWLSLHTHHKPSDTSTTLQQYRDHVGAHLEDAALCLLRQSTTEHESKKKLEVHPMSGVSSGGNGMEDFTSKHTNISNNGESVKVRQNVNQRDEVLLPQSYTGKFLYLMLEQTDTHRIDWQRIADGTGMKTPTSARNRYSHFKREIESQVARDEVALGENQKTDGLDDLEVKGTPLNPLLTCPQLSYSTETSRRPSTFNVHRSRKSLPIEPEFSKHMTRSKKSTQPRHNKEQPMTNWKDPVFIDLDEEDDEYERKRSRFDGGQ